MFRQEPTNVEIESETAAANDILAKDEDDVKTTKHAAVQPLELAKELVAYLAVFKQVPWPLAFRVAFVLQASLSCCIGPVDFKSASSQQLLICLFAYLFPYLF